MLVTLLYFSLLLLLNATFPLGMLIICYINVQAEAVQSTV